MIEKLRLGYLNIYDIIELKLKKLYLIINNIL